MSSQANQNISQNPFWISHITAFFLILLELKWQIHSYTLVIPWKAWPDSRPHGQSLYLFSDQNYALCVGTYPWHVPNQLILGIPIDRVPKSKSCVFCLGMKFIFFLVSWSLSVARIILLKRCYACNTLWGSAGKSVLRFILVTLQTCYVKVRSFLKEWNQLCRGSDWEYY